MTSFSVIKLDKEMIPGVVSTMMSRYAAEECGICEQPGPKEVVWPSSKGIGVHAPCFALIDPTQTLLVETINHLFEDSHQRNLAHKKAVAAVRTLCGAETLLSYCEKNGPDALTHLFNTVGVEAAKKYASKT